MKLSFNNFFKKDTLKMDKTINPHRDWVVFLWILFFVSSFLIISSLYLLSKIKKDEIFKINRKTGVGQVSINKDLLEKTLERFQEKKNAGDKIFMEGVSFSDPSK